MRNGIGQGPAGLAAYDHQHSVPSAATSDPAPHATPSPRATLGGSAQLGALAEVRGAPVPSCVALARRDPPERDPAKIESSKGLPGRSIRSLETLVANGTSLHDCDWLSLCHFGEPYKAVKSHSLGN